MSLSKLFGDPNTPLVSRPLSSKVKLSFVILVLIVILCSLYNLNSVRIPSWPSRESFSAESFSLPNPLHKLHSLATGYLPIQDAESLCSRFNWPTYPHRTSRRKIYDLVLVDTELDWLEIRMHEYQYDVDYFVIVEATTTFTRNPKPLTFKANLDRFQKFYDKIIYRAINYDHITGDNPWECEEYSRNALYDLVFPSLLGAAAPELGDIILVSDADEVPRRSTLTVLRNCQFPERTTLRTKSFKYSFQWLWTGNGLEGWYHPQVTYFTGLNETIKPQDLRLNLHGVAWDKIMGGWAGWHCSYCFATVAEIIHKIESFSHTEANAPENKHPSVIVDRIRKGLGIFEFNDTLTRVEMEDLPQYVNENPSRFAYMIDRDPKNANFKDYVA